MVNIDSDIQFPPEEIPSLLEPIITKKYKVVFGSRFLKNSGKKNYKGSFLRDKGNMIIASVVSILANRKFTDISAGFKAWTREAIIDTGYEDEKYCSFPELAIRCSFNNIDICEVPIKDYADRIHGHSIHQSRFQLIIGGMNFILKSFRTFIILKFNKFNKPHWTRLIPKKSFDNNKNIII